MSNLTSLAWSLTSVRGRPRLVFHFAPGRAQEAVRYLGELGVRGHRVGPRSLRVERAAGLVALLRHLVADPDFHSLLDSYTALTGRRGRTMSATIQGQRQHLLRALIARAERRAA